MIENTFQLEQLDWAKVGPLIPVIIQDANTLQVLMLGYMNKEALLQTQEKRVVTFYSRSKQRLWTKGETSGNYLHVVNITTDCDQDTLLIQVNPVGPSCHLNNPSCFGIETAPGLGFLAQIEKIINERYQQRPENSYTTKLFNEGTYRIAQKVGEEGVEVALAAVASSNEALINEAADLFFHLIVLLRQCDINFLQVLAELKRRAKS